ncbi:MAG TPA: hypothetical protein VNX01_12030 [Bacteroidia bacterium]|nr:hypothetical protein [Bacteroidia bacterium]
MERKPKQPKTKKSVKLFCDSIILEKRIKMLEAGKVAMLKLLKGVTDISAHGEFYS